MTSTDTGFVPVFASHPSDAQSARDREAYLAWAMEAVVEREKAASRRRSDGPSGGNPGANAEAIAARNARKDLIVAHVRERGPTRASAFAKLLGVTKHTVHQYARELADEGRLRVETVKGGRPRAEQGSVFHLVEAGR